MRHGLTSVGLAFLLAGAAAALAHEFWIQPDAFRPAVGVATPVRLVVGDGFPGERRARDGAKAERFEMFEPGGGAARPIEGKDKDEPAGTFSARRPGVHAAAYRGRESIITLEAEKFEAYLREEGLDSIVAKRKELGESDRPGREAYSRCAKALLCAGGETDGAWDASAGLSLELVPTSNPYEAGAGDRLAFVLLERGKAVSGAQVAALTSVGGKTLRLNARTDEKGRATFELPASGLWLINAVRMERARGRTDVEWESVWSSLTFELGPAKAAKGS